ncbi:MAG: S-methyl-5-thioribose-1-phosphate isomerase [Kiritimatiellae bacterium]|nr:S-methyl-5-thioribose-1-phosphate isomerase [Kiritimatiellia bacterium]
MKTLLTIAWVPEQKREIVPGFIRAVDQTLLPGRLRFLEIRRVEELWAAIKTLRIRGAPAIGVAAAMGVVLAAQKASAAGRAGMLRAIARAGDYLASSRPTAVNLFWALERMKKKAVACAALPPDEIIKTLAREAVMIFEEDGKVCRSIGRHGLALMRGKKSVLTHCNAGGLAASCYGTALAPIYLAAEKGRALHVFVDETRPLLQGARLTAWELTRAGIKATLICDNMAAWVMREKKVDLIIVGADRIAANGDTANKIGTYGLAVLARAHHLPFVVCAPTSTFDSSARAGRDIPIEKRGREEIVTMAGKKIAPDKAGVYAPAFDVTPAELISAIVCEKGVCFPPYAKSLRRAGRAR